MRPTEIHGCRCLFLSSLIFVIQSLAGTCHPGHSRCLAGMTHHHVTSTSLLSLWTDLIGDRRLRRFILPIERSVVLGASLMRISLALWIALGFALALLPTTICWDPTIHASWGSSSLIWWSRMPTKGQRGLPSPIGPTHAPMANHRGTLVIPHGTWDVEVPNLITKASPWHNLPNLRLSEI